MFSIQSGSGSEAAALASVALKNRLYVSGWMLSGIMVRIRRSPKPNDIVSIVTVDGKPISVAVLTDGSDTIACFTKKAYRKKGYGKLAVTGLKQSAEKGVRGHSEGLNGCSDFFQKCGLPIASWWSGQ